MKRMKKSILLLTVFSFLVVMQIGCKEDEFLNNGNETSLKSATVAQSKHVPNEMLVKFKDGVNEAQKSDVLAKVNGKIKEKILTKMMEKEGDKQGIELVSVPGVALEAVARVKGFPEIEYAEPNYIYEHSAVSNDPYFTNGSLWGMSSTNTFGSQAATAWSKNHTGSNTVYVGIIDEGVMNTHPELQANCWLNLKDPVDGIDNDGNGYIDDKWGWDFDGNDNSTFDGTQDDHAT